MEQKHLGKQFLVELYGGNFDALNNKELVAQTMTKTAVAIGATILHEYFHMFTPQGVSGSIIIAESHLNIHTWPEHGYAAVDLFTCGEDMDLEPGVQILRDAFGAEEVELTKILRGSKEKINQLHVR